MWSGLWKKTLLSSSKASSVTGWLIGVSKHTTATIVVVTVTSVGSCAVESGIAVAHQISNGVALTEALQQVLPGTIDASLRDFVSGAAGAALDGDDDVERWDGDRFGCPSFPLPEYFLKEKDKKKREEKPNVNKHLKIY